MYPGTDAALTSAKDSRMLVGEKTDGFGTGLEVMQGKRIRISVAV